MPRPSGRRSVGSSGRMATRETRSPFSASTNQIVARSAERASATRSHVVARSASKSTSRFSSDARSTSSERRLTIESEEETGDANDDDDDENEHGSTTGR